jgi:hypothetical protein
MRSFDTEFKKYTDTVRLKASERSALRARVLSYMEYHPLPKTLDVQEPVPSLVSSVSFGAFRFTRRGAQLAGGLLALVLIVLPFAAEHSIPGQVLYLVKTGINEPVQAQFAASPYEKIEFETKLVERRIAEARALAQEGKLTEDVQTELTETVKEHTQNVNDQIAALRTQDADGAAIAQIAFNSSLEVQSAVLHAEGGENAASPIGTMLTTVVEARDAASSSEEQAPSYDALLARVEGEAAHARELSETITESATADEANNIQRRLSDIDRLIREVKASHDAQVSAASASTTASSSVEAYAAKKDTGEDLSGKLVSTLQVTQKLIAFMTDIDVRAAVPLDTLVPVVLSDDERIAHANDALTSIAERITHITEALPEVTDSEVAARISAGLAQNETLSVQAHEALEAMDLDAAESAVAELTTRTADLESLEATSSTTPAAEDVSTETESVSEDASSTATSSEGGLGDTSATPPAGNINASLRSMLRF